MDALDTLEIQTSVRSRFAPRGYCGVPLGEQTVSKERPPLPEGGRNLEGEMNLDYLTYKRIVFNMLAR